MNEPSYGLFVSAHRGMSRLQQNQTSATMGAEFRKGEFKCWQGLTVTSGIASLLLVGGLGAGFFLEGVSEATVAVVLAFGAAALIYLIAEELLVEAIQAEESLFSTAMLFVGFGVLLALKLFSADGPQ